MTNTQKWIINYLIGRGWTSPTQIGYAYGDSIHGNNSFHCFHSAWASPRCKELVRLGYLQRSNKGHYRIKTMQCKDMPDRPIIEHIRKH